MQLAIEHLNDFLLDGDALCQISWLIHIQPFEIGHVVGQKLKGDGEEDRRQGGKGFRDEDHVIHLLGEWPDPTERGGQSVFLLLPSPLRYWKRPYHRLRSWSPRTTTGISRSIRAMGPCFISPAG